MESPTRGRNDRDKFVRIQCFSKPGVDFGWMEGFIWPFDCDDSEGISHFYSLNLDRQIWFSKKWRYLLFQFFECLTIDSGRRLRMQTNYLNNQKHLFWKRYLRIWTYRKKEIKGRIEVNITRFDKLWLAVDSNEGITESTNTKIPNQEINKKKAYLWQSLVSRGTIEGLGAFCYWFRGKKASVLIERQNGLLFSGKLGRGSLIVVGCCWWEMKDHHTYQKRKRTKERKIIKMSTK